MGYGYRERYLHTNSLIHRLDPRLKLVSTLAFILVVVSTPPRAWLAFVLLAGLAVSVTLGSGIPLAEALKRSTVALPFAAMVAISVPFTQAGQVLWAWRPFGAEGWSLNITDEGLLLFMAVVIRAWLSVVVTGLLVATTSFPDLMAALHSFRVPVILTVTISFLYRYLFVLVDEAMRLMTARQARSVGRGGSVVWRARVLGGMIGSLFIRSYERSERIYAAMLSRGFDRMASPARTALGGVHGRETAGFWESINLWAAILWIILLAISIVLGRFFPPYQL